MLTPGLVYSGSNSQFDFHPEFDEYYRMINQKILKIAISKGKIDSDGDNIIYHFHDDTIICLFTVWLRSDIDRYELRINPEVWNDLPPDADVDRLRFFGFNEVYHFQYHDSYPMLFSHIPGNWKCLLDKYL